MARPEDQQRADGARPPPSRRRGGDVFDDLLVAAGRGGLIAYAEFYDRTVPTVFGVLRGVLGDSARAEQATERVYLQMWCTAPRFDPTDRSAYSLLMFTVHGELRRQLRGMVRRGQSPTPVARPVRLAPVRFLRRFGTRLRRVAVTRRPGPGSQTRRE